MEEAIKNMVWISTEEYRELIEAKCKAEAEAERQRSNWYRDNTRANQAEISLNELKTKCEEERLKNKADRAEVSKQIEMLVDFINVNDLGAKFIEFKEEEQNGRD